MGAKDSAWIEDAIPVTRSARSADSEDVRYDSPVTKQLEKRLLRKIDYTVLPLMGISMLISFLDRGNIGNARVLGMQKDTGLSNQQFLNIIMMFFLGYVLLELPACLSLRYVHARFAFGVPIMAFGIFVILMAFCTSYAALMVLRVLVGLGEVFVNNAFIFLTLWYKPEEVALRIAIMYTSTTIAGATSGLISYACGVTLEGHDGLYDWQWMFIIEGVMAVGIGVIVMIFLPGTPDEVAKKGSLFIKKEEERQLIAARYHASHNTAGEVFRASQLLVGIQDPKMWLGALTVGSGGVGLGAFSVFLPTLIHAFGFDPLRTQLFVMVPYAFALVGMIASALISKRIGQRAPVVLACLGTTILGFIILISVTGQVASMVGACFVITGAYSGVVLSVSFVLTLHGGYTKRSLAVWLMQIVINVYSVAATQVYRTPPRFYLGHGLALGLYCLGFGCATTIWVICKRENAQKLRRREDFAAKGEVDPDMEKSYEELCDRHPGFLYAL
ncbi:uncharacterized protein A1O9_06518 [Exophiala aquamarina CBS 119918]|uniref:Major facilitator superfamily (MFS) profile domain-containing protein n=1 Tax=Exophiala aquamarina CBS 119918 TaxID=1182545 RepID=A0A072PFQ0_9EURO|nr:uncharacterized protein A1O9_06518 [Exophiala aquamarina CBS 119918]KEF58592.1 hypothetical protein A1O9_06518 [Exophiala aquamarina CBS 119918]